MAKTYPAKKAAGNRKQPLPPVLEVPVRQDNGGTYIAHARKKTARTITSAASAARKLAQLLGYPPSADVRYARTDEYGIQVFEIVEVQP